MKIVVIGGTGRIGSNVVNILRANGHDAVPAAPSLGVNTITGEGLADALTGADVVVDVTNSPSFEPAAVLEFFETSTRNLIAAEVEAGVGHHVALSIVGIERTPESGYFRAKVAQEKLIESGSVPYSIVRATQFFEFVDAIANTSTQGTEVHLAPVAFQPIAADDVAMAVAKTAQEPPLNGRREIAGPDRMRFDEVIARRLESQNDPRIVVVDPQAPYFGAVMSEQSLVPLNGAQLGATSYEEWLRIPVATR